MAGDSMFERWYRSVHPRLGTSLALAFGDPGLAQEAADEACARALAADDDDTADG